MTSTLTVYRVAPQQHRKAIAEARRAGVKAYIPKEARQHKRTTTQVPIMPGYAALTGHVYDRHYIQKRVGPIARGELKRVYDNARDVLNASRRAKLKAAAPILYAVGDDVEILRGAFEGLTATIVKTKGKAVTLSLTVNTSELRVQTTVDMIRRRQPPR